MMRPDESVPEEITYADTPEAKAMLKEWKNLADIIKKEQKRREATKYITIKEFQDNYLEYLYHPIPKFTDEDSRKDYMDKLKHAQDYIIEEIGKFADWVVYTVDEKGERVIIKKFPKQMNTSILYHFDSSKNANTIKYKNQQAMSSRNGLPHIARRDMNNFRKAVIDDIAGGIEFGAEHKDIIKNKELQKEIVTKMNSNKNNSFAQELETARRKTCNFLRSNTDESLEDIAERESNVIVDED